MSSSRSFPSRLFEYGGFATARCSASTPTLEWLEEFLGPWFVVRPDPAPLRAPVVGVRVDAALFHDRMRAVQAPVGKVACFTMDQGEELLALVLDETGHELAVDATWGFALGVRTNGGGARTIDVLAENERPAARLALMRVLRELASAHAASLGEIPLHAAAVAEGEAVTLFVGGKGAGKTTLLVHALTLGTTRFVSNDRVFVRLGSAPPLVRGMPSIVSLRDATLALSGSLRAALRSGAWHFASTVAEARARLATGTRPEGAGRHSPPGLSPAQLCAVLEVQPVVGGKPTRIVFPETRPAGEPRFSLRRLTPEEAAARLLESGLFAGGRSATFVSGTAPERSALESALHELAARVPCFSCVLGPDAYVSRSVWDAAKSFTTSAPTRRSATMKGTCSARYEPVDRRPSPLPSDGRRRSAQSRSAPGGCDSSRTGHSDGQRLLRSR